MLNQFGAAKSVTILESIAEKNIISLQEAQRITAETFPQTTQLWQAYLATELVDEEVALIAQAKPLLKKADDQLANLQTWYANKDVAAIINFTQTGIYPLFDPLNEVFTKLNKLQAKVAKQEYELSKQRFQKTRVMNISMISLSLVVALVIGFIITAACCNWAASPANLHQATQLQEMMEFFKLAQNR